jgi:hypothetical protein
VISKNAVVKIFRERELTLCRDSLANPAKDYAEYRERVGQFVELQHLFNALLEEAEDDNDE